jgi:hypothetical protein
MIIENEASSEANDQSHWAFKLEKEQSGKKETEEVVETSAGQLNARAGGKRILREPQGKDSR